MSNYGGFPADPLLVQYGGLLFRLILTPDRTLIRYLRKKNSKPFPLKKVISSQYFRSSMEVCNLDLFSTLNRTHIEYFGFIFDTGQNPP